MALRIVSLFSHGRSTMMPSHRLQFYANEKLGVGEKMTITEVA